MSHDEARRLERILKREGRFHEVFLLALPEMTRDELLDVLDGTMAALKRQSAAEEALKRGLRDAERMAQGEITLEQMAEELKARPIRQENHPPLSPERAAEVTRVVRGLIGGTL